MSVVMITNQNAYQIVCFIHISFSSLQWFLEDSSNPGLDVHTCDGWKLLAGRLSPKAVVLDHCLGVAVDSLRVEGNDMYAIQ